MEPPEKKQKYDDEDDDAQHPSAAGSSDPMPAHDAGQPLLPTMDQELPEIPETSETSPDPKDPKDPDKELLCFYSSCDEEVASIANKVYSEHHSLNQEILDKIQAKVDLI